MITPTLNELSMRHAIHSTELRIRHQSDKRARCEHLRPLLRLKLNGEGAEMGEKRIREALKERGARGRGLENKVTRRNEGSIVRIGLRRMHEATSRPRGNRGRPTDSR